MRKLLLTLLLCSLLPTMAGCVIDGFSGDPARRTTQLVYVSENLRLFQDEWERFWFLDQPDHQTPWRTHGGVI